MMVQNFEQQILAGIQGLPAARLAEIVDFVYFVRQRELAPQALADEIWAAGLNAELAQLSRNEEAHLEKEFEDYERRCPRE